MKKLFLSAIAVAGLSLQSFSQVFFENVTFTGAFPPAGSGSYTAKIEGGFTQTFADGNWASGWTEFFPNTVDYAAGTDVITGDITSDRTIATNAILRGTVHVKNGATLKFDAGVIVRCESGSSLLITKGSKIDAIGTLSQPIVFTSSKGVGLRAPGDWAGMLLIGNSQVNTNSGKRQYEALPNDPLAEYGGGRGAELNLNDNSGEMRFVRIEFAGYNYLPDQELNGLTFGAVGAGTRVNFIQVSYARDDSFEWFGGTSRHKYMIAYSGIDDDFDMDEGFAGKVQFGLGVRNPAVFETAAGGTSNGFEHDNNTGVGTPSAVVPGNNNPTPNTAPMLSHMTMVGPWVGKTPTAGNKFGRGMEMRSAVATSVYNSVVIGYATLASLVHPSVSIEPSTGFRLQLANGVVNSKFDGLTQAEYKNVHLLSVSGSAVVYTAAANQPAPTLDFAAYMNGTNNNTSQAIAEANLFPNRITNFNVSAAVSYQPEAASLVAVVPAIYTGLIAPFTGDAVAIATQPSVSVSKSSVSFGNKLVGQTFSAQTFTVTSSNLTGAGVSLTSNNPDFIVALTNGVATVNYIKTAAGSSFGAITINSGDSRISSILVPVTAALVAPASPVLQVDATSLSFSVLETTANTVYTSNSQVVNVFGRNLTADVLVTAPTGYEVGTTPVGTYGATVTLTRGTNNAIEKPVYVKLKTATIGSNPGSLSIVSGSQSALVTLLANTNPVFTVGSATIDVFTGAGISMSSFAANFNVRGDRLPLSISLTSNSPDVEISTVSASAGYAATAVLTTTGRITQTTSNVWVRYIGSLNPSTAGLQVAVISVAGVLTPVPVVIRLNNAGATQSGKWILTDASSPFVTALGFTFNNAISGTPYLYKADNNALIGQVKTIVGVSNVVELKANATLTTNTLYALTFAGTIDTDATSAEITGTGTNFMGLPSGLPFHAADGTLIGYISAVTSATMLTLQAPAAITTTTSAFKTSAILFKRPQATIAVASGIPTSPSPGGLVISSYTNGIPNPATATITVNGSNLDGAINVGINPALSASGYMFEIYDGTPATFAGGSFSLSITPNANGTVSNKILTVRYVPTNITTYSLPALNIIAAHSTELLVLANGKSLTSGASSSDPRGNIAFTLRGNAQPALTVSKTSLGKFFAYTGVASGIQNFVLKGTRVAKDITITAPVNFQLSKSADFTGASNILVLAASVTGLAPDLPINVRYMRSDVSSDNGAISINTEGIAPLSVAVSGETVGYTSLLNLASANGSGVVSFTGATTATVNGGNLSSAIMVTASTDYMISETEMGDYTSTLSFSPDPMDFGDVTAKPIFVKYIGTAAGFAGTLTATSNGAVTEVINLVGTSSVTSTESEIAVTSQITIYPNPTEGAATLAVNFGGAENIAFTIYDATGSVVTSFSDSVNGLTTYPIAGLYSGMYLVKVVSGSTVSTVTLIVR